MPLIKSLVAAAFAFGLATAAQASAVYTSAPNNGTVGWLGVHANSSIGEVFTVPVDGNSRLDSFSFYLKGDLGAAYGGITDWTGTDAGGADVFSTQPFTAYSADGVEDFTEITVDTGGIDLTPGKQYLAYFSLYFLEDSGMDTLALGNRTAIDRGLVFTSGNPLGAGWNSAFKSDVDLAGSFVFSGAADAGADVPEPGSLALLGLGIAGLAGMRRRKQA